MSINEEIIAAAEKLSELCYTIEDCEKCPLEYTGCGMNFMPMEWAMDEVKKAAVKDDE